MSELQEFKAWADGFSVWDDGYAAFTALKQIEQVRFILATRGLEGMENQNEWIGKLEEVVSQEQIPGG